MSGRFKPTRAACQMCCVSSMNAKWTTTTRRALRGSSCKFLGLSFAGTTCGPMYGYIATWMGPWPCLTGPEGCPAFVLRVRLGLWPGSTSWRQEEWPESRAGRPQTAPYPAQLLNQPKKKRTIYLPPNRPSLFTVGRLALCYSSHIEAVSGGWFEWNELQSS